MQTGRQADKQANKETHARTHARERARTHTHTHVDEQFHAYTHLVGVQGLDVELVGRCSGL